MGGDGKRGYTGMGDSRVNTNSIREGEINLEGSWFKREETWRKGGKDEKGKREGLGERRKDMGKKES